MTIATSRTTLTTSDQETLEASSLGRLDGGRAASLINRALRTALEDCADRATNDKPRRVVITVSLTPSASAAGQLVSVATDLAVKATLPPAGSDPEMLPTMRRGDRTVAYLVPGLFTADGDAGDGERADN